VEHAGVVSMLTSRKAEYQMDENIVSLQLFSYAFDGFVTSFFTTLISGGQAILMGPQQKGDVNRIREEIKNHRISHMICIPTLYRMLMTSLQPGEGQSLKVITLAGEKVSLQEVESTKEKLPQTELVVEYGVTEGTVLSTINRHQETSKRITIGKAIPNNQVYILGKGKQLQPMGIPGELHISGAGVARGYMNQNELTQHRFIDNPFKGKEGQQVYCTGDLARILPDGNFEFLGRKDRQVKIRGYRIELGEIESAMIIHPGVRNAVAIDREDSNGERELVAYVVPDPKRSFPICKILELKNKGQLFHKSPFELPGDIPVFGFNEQEIRYIYEHITKEYEEIQLEEGACVFDIGAHIGLFSIYLHQKVKKPQIWAFEPIPEIFDCLEFNNRILGMNMNLNKYAVGKINENRSFTYYPRNTAGSSCYADTEEDAEHMKAFLTYKRTEQQEEGTENEKLDEFISERMQGQAIDCPIKTISQVIKENNLKKIDLIKIVAEKSELDILKGIQEQDWGKIQQLAIEVHEEGDSLESILKLLKNNGYQVKIRQSEIQKKMGACNLIAQRQPQESTSSLGNQEKKTKLEWQWATAGKLKKDLKKRLLSRLPDYMVPSHIVLMPSLPLTVHGKLDLKALPSPEILQQDYEGPGNITEKKLAGIWAKILNLKEEEISIHSNFFEIGGHSIKASNLAIQVEKEFGVGIPLLEVFKTPTIKGLSEYVLTKKRKLPSITSTGHQNLVLLKKSEINDKQLFFIHDGTGDIEGYVELVRELGSVGSCWGIKVMHPEQLAPYNTTFEEVAARYIELIKEVQEKGAYHIMGWSLGGILAYEMAYQLENQGKKIGFLGMIDTYKFTGKAQKEQEGFTLEGEKAFITEVLNQEDIPGWLKKITKIDKIWETIAIYFENIADGEAQLNLWVERMYIHEVIPGIKQMEIRKKIFYLNVFRSLFRAHISYLNSPLKQLKTTIHYFKAKDNVGVETQIPFVDRGGETQKFLELEGDHYSLLKAPAVIKLAQEIRKYNEAK
jgi:FkbM family methyltransferase